MTDTSSASRSYPARAATFWRSYSRSRGAVFAFLFLVALISAAVLANYLFPGDVEAPDMSRAMLPPSFSAVLGTDYLGRDQLTLLVFGARTSLIVAFAAGGLLAVVGTIAGLLAGYFGGKVDGLMMRIADVFLTIPILPLILVIVSLTGPSLLNVMFAIGLTSWPVMARVVRSDSLALMKREFIEIERVMGAGSGRIVFKHLLPNQLNSVLVYASLSIPVVILTEASLEFLGLTPLSVSWGFMLNVAMNYWIRGTWWMSFFPGLAIFATALAFYFVSEGLKEALNPKLKRRRESLVAQIAERKK
jgi:ABC-type dipeptide/oligopeptide/nickel transport system permease subunit